MTLPPIYAPLDEKIASLVMALREAGFPTQHSCDGHAPGLVPTINVGSLWPQYAGLGLNLTRGTLCLWLRQHNVTANVCQVYTTLEGEEEVFPFIRIEIYSPLAEAKL